MNVALVQEINPSERLSWAGIKGEGIGDGIKVRWAWWADTNLQQSAALLPSKIANLLGKPTEKSRREREAALLILKSRPIALSVPVELLHLLWGKPCCLLQYLQTFKDCEASVVTALAWLGGLRSLDSDRRFYSRFVQSNHCTKLHRDRELFFRWLRGHTHSWNGV